MLAEGTVAPHTLGMNSDLSSSKGAGLVGAEDRHGTDVLEGG